MATCDPKSVSSEFINDVVRRFQSKISSLSSGISQVLPEFANKALEKNLITLENATDALNLTKNAYERSSTLLYILLGRIKTSPSEFDVVLEILRSIPAMEPFMKDLQPSSAITVSSFWLVKTAYFRLHS